MAIFRVYTGEDGHSHVEELPIGEHPLLADAHAAARIQFHKVPTDFVNDWHAASERLVFIVLDGEIELGLPGRPARVRSGAMRSWSRTPPARGTR